MLLGAAKHLAETRNFSGTVYLCFSPAEEGGGGCKAMLDDGLFVRFKPKAVYGLHNWPGRPIGELAVKEGPVLAAVEIFRITIKGRGSHAGEPHLGRDPIVAGSQIISSFQTIVSRVVDPQQPAVVSVTQFTSGQSQNVIPDEAFLQGTTRCYDLGVQRLISSEMERIATDISSAHAVSVTIEREPNPYPPTINDPEQAKFVHSVLKDLVGDENAKFGHAPTMAGEDFSFFANEVPGVYTIIGNGDSAALHNPGYDFNDKILPLGVAYWTRLVEAALPVR